MRCLGVVAMTLVACSGRDEPTAPAVTAPAVTAPATPPKAGAPVAPRTLKLAKVETEYAVAVPAGADLAALEKLAHDKAPAATVSRKTVAALFDDDQLGFLTRDLPAAEARGLTAATDTIVLHGAGTDGMALAKQLATATREVADAAHGWVLDPETFQLFTASAFHPHVPGEHPDIRQLIVVHSVMGAHEQPFLDTAGLRRYGFPELYFPEAPVGDVNPIMHLINAAAQALLDGGDVSARGEIAIDVRTLGWKISIIGDGTGKAVWKTRWATERDAKAGDDLFVELVPPAGTGTEAVAKLVDDCFGHAPDAVVDLKDDDPEILAAAEHARADLAELRTRYSSGVPFEERLSVKARFTDGTRTEWMWVAVVSFRGDSFQGTLANDPELLTSMHDGQKVTVKIADVGDYLLAKKGGESVGGYSIEVMRKRGLVPDGK